MKRYSHGKKHSVEREARRAAIAVIAAVAIMIVVGFVVFVLREKGVLPKSRRRERH